MGESISIVNKDVIQKLGTKGIVEIEKLLTVAGGKYGDNVIGECSQKLVVEVGKKHIIKISKCYYRKDGKTIKFKKEIVSFNITEIDDSYIKIRTY